MANQLNVSSATFYQARSAPPPDPASATQLTTPGGLYFDGTYYNVWDRNALAWVRLSTGAGSGSVAAANVTAGTLGPEVISSSVAASAVGTVQLANNSVKHEDMARGADTAVGGSAGDVALGLNADLLDGLDSSGFAAASSGVCYTSWAGDSCASGWTAVVQGVMLIPIAKMPSANGTQRAASDIVCLRTDGNLIGGGRTFFTGLDPNFAADFVSFNRDNGGNAYGVSDNAGDSNVLVDGPLCAICCK